MTIGEKINELKNKKRYTEKYYDIELSGWNDGVYDVLIVGEDSEFLFYQKFIQNRFAFGMINKNYIVSAKVSKKSNLLHDNISSINRDYFCEKHVFIELSSREGFIKGFFDFRNDDYLDVIVNSFSNSKVELNFGKELNINDISKIEELIE